jgi:hypothetical protein
MEKENTMAGSSHSFKHVLVYILLGGAIMFLAIFLGIQAGFAIRGDQTAELTPESLPNRSLLKPGDPIPPLPVRDMAGNELILDEITESVSTIVGVVLPGCDPCKKLLSEWRNKGILNGQNDFQVVLLATSPSDSLELGPLAEFAEIYPVYFCKSEALKELIGISTFPTVMGLSNEGTVSFVANAYVHQLDIEFFDEYL